MDAATFFNQYKWAAIWADMMKGIPASITLAQAAIESEYGASRLATEGNNYFGIKAYDNPRSFPIITASDDLPNEPFRKYKNAAESFADHGYFLKTEQPRYANLFSTHSYVDWANGLHDDGYATSPNYASTLISTIESNNLQRFDVWGNYRYLIFAILILLLIIAGALLLDKYTKYSYKKIIK